MWGAWLKLWYPMLLLRPGWRTSASSPVRPTTSNGTRWRWPAPPGRCCSGTSCRRPRRPPRSAVPRAITRGTSSCPRTRSWPAANLGVRGAPRRGRAHRPAWSAERSRSWAPAEPRLSCARLFTRDRRRPRPAQTRGGAENLPAHAPERRAPQPGLDAPEQLERFAAPVLSPEQRSERERRLEVAGLETERAVQHLDGVGAPGASERAAAPDEHDGGVGSTAADEVNACSLAVELGFEGKGFARLGVDGQRTILKAGAECPSAARRKLDSAPAASPRCARSGASFPWMCGSSASCSARTLR